MTNNFSDDLQNSFTLDPTGQLNDLFFILLSLYGDDKGDIEAGEVFGQGEKWAQKWRDRAVKRLDCKTWGAAIGKAWKEKIFTHDNQAVNADWKKKRFYYYGKKFYEKKEE